MSLIEDVMFDGHIQLLPTGTCFDDALDYVSVLLKDAGCYTERKKILTTHYVCHGLVGPDDDPIAHAWVEVGDDVWISGLWRGKQVFTSLPRSDYYASMGARDITRYTCQEVVDLNRKSNHFGPWEERYVERCRKPEDPVRVIGKHTFNR